MTENLRVCASLEQSSAASFAENQQKALPRILRRSMQHKKNTRKPWALTERGRICRQGCATNGAALLCNDNAWVYCLYAVNVARTCKHRHKNNNNNNNNSWL